MQTYALLGATGATGSSVLRHLLNTQSDVLHINLLVRSPSKLLSIFPDLPTRRTPRVHIVQGDSTNANALDTCLHKASVVFMCVAQNGSPIGTTLCQDTVTALIDALGRRQQAEGSIYQPCLVIQIRSASLNPPLAAQIPRWVHQLVRFCLFAAYTDLQRASVFYEEASKAKLLQYVLVDPPTLHDADGIQPTGYRLITTEPQAPALSYADLGVALCEIAGRMSEFHGRAVGVTATGPVRQNWGVLAGYLLQGGISHLDYMVGRENLIVLAICVALLLLPSIRP